MMKMMTIPLVSLTALLIPVGAASAQTCVGAPGPGMARLTVDATDLKNAQGEVAITIYNDDKSRFLAKGGKFLRARVPAVQPVTSACFWLKPGVYEIAQYHDENADRHFNRTLFVPKEGFGFSNDASTTLGLPSMKDTQFEVPAGGRTIRVKMRYRR